MTRRFDAAKVLTYVPVLAETKSAQIAAVTNICTSWPGGRPLGGQCWFRRRRPAAQIRADPSKQAITAAVKLGPTGTPGPVEATAPRGRGQQSRTAFVAVTLVLVAVVAVGEVFVFVGEHLVGVWMFVAAGRRAGADEVLVKMMCVVVGVPVVVGDLCVFVPVLVSFG